MIREIIDSITLDYTFKDVQYGIVYPVFSKTGFVPGSQNGKWYEDAVPDSSRKSIVYWEDYGSSVIDSNKHYWRISQSVRLICWMNFNRIDIPYEKCVGQILYGVPKQSGNTLIQYQGELPKDVNIFNRYNYKDGKTYIAYPFDVVAMKFNVLYYVPCSQDYL